MKLNRITDLRQLKKYTPQLLALHASLEGKWEPDLTQSEFFVELLNNFNKDSYFFGDFVGEELAYFAVLLKQDSTKALFWLFYMNPKMRNETKGILADLKVFMREQGFSTVYTQSTRTSSSYERWLEKFGAEKLAIIYKFKL